MGILGTEYVQGWMNEPQEGLTFLKKARQARYRDIDIGQEKVILLLPIPSVSVQ